MQAEKTQRGFVIVRHPNYTRGKAKRLVQESSAIGDYDDSMEKPGSSFLWVGEHHHLNREDVAELIQRLQTWLNTGRLQLDTKDAAIP